MIRVTAYKDKTNGSYKGFKVLGHSDYSEEGSDIICAGVSAVVINTVNSLEVLSQDPFTQETDKEQGLIDIKFKSELSEGGKLLMDSMMMGLESIAEGSQENVKVSYREV